MTVLFFYADGPVYGPSIQKLLAVAKTFKYNKYQFPK